MRKKSLKTHQNCSIQKTARKKSYYSKNESILKMAKNGPKAKAIAHAKYPQFGSKNKIALNMRKTSLQTHWSCCKRKMYQQTH